ncbi:protein of unassigned function [Methylobacterium oryzae CBMB20]|uniref:Protein of unassigned function n=1 Tax=Methylobacterium oryzae CBMB20 TaxID=693986 RepID=A0A089NSL2_9HYPH|nr:protein of unassigned function [Methylobacterium oryzae CBMB20]
MPHRAAARPERRTDGRRFARETGSFMLLRAAAGSTGGHLPSGFRRHVDRARIDATYLNPRRADASPDGRQPAGGSKSGPGLCRRMIWQSATIFA